MRFRYFAYLGGIVMIPLVAWAGVSVSHTPSKQHAARSVLGLNAQPRVNQRTVDVSGPPQLDAIGKISVADAANVMGVNASAITDSGLSPDERQYGLGSYSADNTFCACSGLGPDGVNYGLSSRELEVSIHPYAGDYSVTGARDSTIDGQTAYWLGGGGVSSALVIVINHGADELNIVCSDTPADPQKPETLGPTEAFAGKVLEALYPTSNS